mgnify:FL=1
MKKILKLLIIGGILGFIGFRIYSTFLTGERIDAHFDRDFSLNVGDYAEVENEAIVKFLGINDNRCKDQNCEREGEMVAKLLVINDHQIKYIKLGTLAESEKTLEKIGYSIKLIAIDENDIATLNIKKLED